VLTLRRLLLLVGMTMPLAACAGFSQLDAGLDGLKGQRRDTAMRILGFPNAQKHVDGRDVYIWSTGQLATDAAEPACEDRYGGGIAATHCVAAPAWFRDRHCTIRVTSDAKGIIVAASRDGDARSCDRYARRFPPAR